jgi:hypothetical protein
MPLKRSGGGVLLVTVEINGTLTLNAMVDSGAVALMVPADCLCRPAGHGRRRASIGPSLTSRNVRVRSAVRGKAEI